MSYKVQFWGPFSLYKGFFPPGIQELEHVADLLPVSSIQVNEYSCVSSLHIRLHHVHSSYFTSP